MKRIFCDPDLSLSQISHHISLSDGTNVLGFIAVNAKGDADPFSITRAPVNRSALKTTSGNQTYSDMEPPWSPVAQVDWSGGMGKEDYDDDVTRFYHADRVNTAFTGRMFLGAQETYSTGGFRSQQNNLPGSLTWSAIKTGDRNYLAYYLTANANFSVTGIYLYLRRHGTPTAALTVELCSNSGGVPWTVLQTATVDTTTITDTAAALYKFAITAEAITSGTTYWVKVYSTAGTDQHHWKVGVNNSAGTSKQSSNGTDWETTNVDLYCRLADAGHGKTPILFDYLYSRYLILNGSSGAPSLYINGDRGVADANTGALTTTVDGTKSWVDDEWIGAIVMIIKGPGLAEPIPWRVITDNNGTTLTHATWTIEHTTSTEYVIINSNKWTEIAGHGLTAPVTDVMVCNNYCYLCQGDAVAIRRWRAYNNSGTFENTWAADSTNKAVFMDTVRESDGALYVWKANNSDGSSDISVARAAAPTSWADMSFGSAIPMRDANGKITGAQEYDQKFWTFREGSVFATAGTKTEEINLREMHTVADYTNGKAHTTNNVYLFFNLGSGVERYYSSALDDVGPNRDDGLPASYQGVISALLSYPGRYFAAVDGGTSGYSSILMHNGTGWHNVYTAQVAGERILAVDFQPIPGTTLDRMWIAVGNDIIWIPFPSLTLDPTKDSNYRYTHYGTWTSGWMYVSMADAYKFFKSVKLFTEDLSSEAQTVEADYQVDDETTWTPLENDFYSSPVQEQDLKEGLGLAAKRIRIRLHLLSNDNTKTPLIKTTVVENISQVAVKYSYAFTYRVLDNDHNLLGAKTEISAEDFQDIVDGWAANLTPLQMNGWRKRFHGKVVYIDPTQSKPISEAKEGYIERLTVVEI